MVNTSLIFAGGLAPSDTTLDIVRAVTNVDLIIAADSGLHIAQKLNLKVERGALTVLLSDLYFTYLILLTEKSFLLSQFHFFFTRF